jgi:hypothetical protein
MRIEALEEILQKVLNRFLKPHIWFFLSIHDPVETWWSCVTSQMQNTSTLSSGSFLLAPYPPSSPFSSRQADSPAFFHPFTFYVKEHICRIHGCGAGSNRDPDPGGQKRPTKVEKNYEILCFEVLDVLFRELKASFVTWTSCMGLGIGKLY